MVRTALGVPKALHFLMVFHGWSLILVAMKSIMLANGLTKRNADCLAKIGVPVNKKAVAKALKDGTLFVACIPRHYGPQTHREVCAWAGVDPASLRPELP
jgi:hypothetical protein